MCRFRRVFFLCCAFLMGRNAFAQGVPNKMRVASDKSHIKATCAMPVDRSACQLKCEVEDTGSGAATNISVGFDAFLPVGTHVYAPTEAEVTLRKSDTLPLPNPTAEF